jgi:hypothetical protein
LISQNLIVLPASSIEWIRYASIPERCLSDGRRSRGCLTTPSMCTTIGATVDAMTTVTIQPITRSGIVKVNRDVQHYLVVQTSSRELPYLAGLPAVTRYMHRSCDRTIGEDFREPGRIGGTER